MSIRDALANTILEITNTEGSDGGFFPFFVTDSNGIEACVRRPVEKPLSYMPRGGYDGSASSKFLIIGPPESGKTKEAIEIINKLDRLRPRTIFYTGDGLQIPNKIPEAFKPEASIIVFIDDFGRDSTFAQKRPQVLATRGGFPRPMQKVFALVNLFEKRFPDVTFIITLNKEYFDTLKIEDEGHNLLLQFKKIELQPFKPKQIERFINVVSNALSISVSEENTARLLKLTYGSVSGLAYFFHTLAFSGVKELQREHVDRYYEVFKSGWESIHKGFSADEQAILEALANLRYWLIIPHKDLVLEVAKSLSKSFFLQKAKKIQEAFDSLVGRVIFTYEDFLLSYDALLPNVNLLPVDVVVKLVLDFAKKQRPGIRIRQSLLNFSDRLMDAGKFDLAIQVNMRLAELLTNYPEIQFNLGTLRAAKGQNTEAEKIFIKMINDYPRDAMTYYNYAVFLSDQKRTDDACQQYWKGLNLAPNDADIHFMLASVLMSLKKFNEADEEFKRGLESNPFDAAARNNYGVLLRSLSKISEAEHQYRQAINIDPSYARAYKNLGVLLFGSGRVAEAEKTYRKSLELDDTDSRTHFNLAVLLRQLERKEEAEKAYRRSIELDPGYAKTYNNLGVLLFSQGRYQEAEEHYKKAIELDKDYKDAHYNLTLVYEKTGDAEKAIEHWEAITRG